MRYSEWHLPIFKKEFKREFDEVIIIGERYLEQLQGINKDKEYLFSNTYEAIRFELEQIHEYMGMKIYNDDILYLADLSFPGFFANVLHHKKPKKCFAFCHATSKNSYDYFAPVRKSKWKVESGQANIFAS